jgi:hypothetical protein
MWSFSRHLEFEEELVWKIHRPKAGHVMLR